MKKLLALVLAVLMLATLAIASVSAADEKINLGEFFYDYGRRIHFAGGRDMLVVDTPTGERLLPMVDAFLARVDVESGVYVRPIPGLLED